MKKLLLIPIFTLILTGCFKADTMDEIVIYTSVYPIEYISEYLYGEHATELQSIYPDGIIVENYTLSEKQITDYSEGDLLIYNGLSDEINYAVDMIENNKKMKIIDASQGMEIENSYEELWLDPSNLLMIAQNISEGLNTYITNPYLITEVEEKYEELKITLSELDADIKLIAENSETKTLLVSQDTLLFLEKYGLEIISLEEDDDLTDKVIADAANLIEDGTVNYIFMKKYEEPSDTIQTLIDETGVEIIYLDYLSSITESDRDEKDDYITIMYDNLELLKKELYQ